MSASRNKAYLAIALGLAAASAGAVAAEQLSSSANERAPAANASPQTADAKSSRALWSWQQVQPPAIPEAANKKWGHTPIDAYILKALEEKGLQPSEAAKREVFIRRATLDVWGLIPSPEAVAEFVNDKSPDAYEKLADRLLASPHYGERQARAWLDLARYADSAGFQQDVARPNNYRYRDYVIDAFNSDKRYDLFIKEQIAGDEIAPDNQDVRVATGFLAGYPDNRNSRDLIGRKYQITTDITDTIGSAILGTSFSCARCHNHKFDKINQKDYFSFQAFFANTAFVDNLKAKKGEVEKRFDEENNKYLAIVTPLRDKRKALIDPIRDDAAKFHKERYLTDSRESLFKAKDQWTPLDRWVNHRYETVTTDLDLAGYLKVIYDDPSNPKRTPELLAKWEEYEKNQKEIRKFDNQRPDSGSLNYTSATELDHPDSPKSYIYFVGNHERPLDEVQPAFPESITDEKPEIVPTEKSSGRRTALAKWLASEKNPLTARVYVNRVWNQYFGKGIVETTHDFGKAGAKPANQALLDYLAYEFVERGWSVKKLHREILLSAVYRQSSDYREDVVKADPENKLLAVFPLHRLEAEEIRDSLLLASGKLNEQVGGPSIYPPIPAVLLPYNSNATNSTYNAVWNASKDPKDQNRRSLYIFVKRSLAYPMLDVYDWANASQVHSKRNVTTTPLQALNTLNNDLIFQWSQSLAGRVIREAGNDEQAQFNRLYQILFSRNATAQERSILSAFLNEHERVIAAKNAEGTFAVATPIAYKPGAAANPLRAAAFVDLVHSVVNSNAFIYRY